MLFADSTLRDEGLATLNLWVPDLQALLDGQGGSALITADQVEAVEDFLAHLSSVASPELQAVIGAELARLPPLDDFIGLSMAEARAILLNDKIYLPFVQ